MDKTKTRVLKIVVDTKSLSASDLKEIEEWENEGGRPVSHNSIWKNIAPLRKGEIFEVVGEDMVYEDGKLYLLADLEILALP
ncbi:MAG TPA: hypothetical protein VJ964_17325 [Balneolaceae bacterium]|nr:hypothetical protein [Balneolaceae bacterium]